MELEKLKSIFSKGRIVTVGTLMYALAIVLTTLDGGQRLVGLIVICGITFFMMVLNPFQLTKEEIRDLYNFSTEVASMVNTGKITKLKEFVKKHNEFMIYPAVCMYSLSEALFLVGLDPLFGIGVSIFTVFTVQSTSLGFVYKKYELSALELSKVQEGKLIELWERFQGATGIELDMIKTQIMSVIDSIKEQNEFLRTSKMGSKFSMS